MKLIKFLLFGVLFGIILTKAEVISWFRIFEMFRFESFHMYGVIGSAVMIGIVVVQIIKRTGMKSMGGEPIVFTPKSKRLAPLLIGGTLFGLGWAMTGACPGPMFVLLGAGYYGILVVIASAILGTFLYGVLKPKLPH